MKDTVLLVVDMQQAIMDEHPVQEKEVIGNVNELIACCREQNVEVIFVRHDDGAGDLTFGQPGWQIDLRIKPREEEKIFDKCYNSAFFKTGLEEYLKERNIKNIILVGLQTEYCIDATCKSAFERGFQVIIPVQCVTSFDNNYLNGEQLNQYFYYKIWSHRYANVFPVTQVLNMLR